MRNEEIVLINPPGKRTSHTKFTVHHGVAPIGMAYIAGCLKANNFNFQVIDALGEDLNHYELFHKQRKIYLRGLPFDEIAQRVSPKAKYILISSMYLADWIVVKELIICLKKKFPQSTIVLGGENPTTFWDKLLRFDLNIDYCVIGEGDEILPNLLKALIKKEPVKEVLGIAFRAGNGTPVMTQRPERLHTLSSFIPDWEQFPLQNYFDQRTTTRSIGKSSMPIIASRGCVYRCSFCTSETKWGTTFVTRPVDEVVAEFKLYRDTYDIEHICVVDLAASINKNWFMDLVREVIKADLGITWELSSGTRSEFLTRENLLLMKKSNFTYLTLAPDTGSEKTVMNIEKRINLGKFEQALSDVIDLDMWVKTNFIVGMYTQSKEEVLDTYKAALRYSLKGVNDVVLYPYVPFPGSKMFNQMMADKEISLDTQESFDLFTLNVSTFSIVALDNPNITYTSSLINYHKHVMVLCFIISMFRKPKRIYLFISRVIQGNAISVFEVALVQTIKWHWLMLKLRMKRLTNSSTYASSIKNYKEDPLRKDNDSLRIS